VRGLPSLRNNITPRACGLGGCRRALRVGPLWERSHRGLVSARSRAPACAVFKIARTFFCEVPKFNSPRPVGGSLFPSCARAPPASDDGCLRFLTTLSGRCKENMEEYWSRAEARSRILPPSSGDFARRHSHRREFVLRLIVYYVVFMIAGDLAAYLLGLITEEAFGSQASLIVFLALYFLFLWVAWVLAVWMTEPKHRASVSTESA